MAQLSAREIQQAAAAKYGLERSQLLRGGRYGGKFQIMVQARAEAMALIRRELRYSYPMIGRLFGGFHHTSVIHLIRRVGNTDPKIDRQALRQRLEQLEERVAKLESPNARL
jgi:chromosomal replication initiation ATPase DnaA